MVHGVPGTTRDPVDTLLEVDGREVALIDTAGLRRRGRSGDVERYSQLRALQAADRSDVALVVCDATEGVTETDLASGRPRGSRHCATLLVMNKWDLAQPDLDDVRGKVRAKSRQRPPIEVCSAVSGEGIHRLLPAALRLDGRYAHPPVDPRAQRDAARAGRGAPRRRAAADGGSPCATWCRPGPPRRSSGWRSTTARS